MRLVWRDVSPGDGPAISTSLTEPETDALRNLATGADVLEIGSAYGYSTVVMALVARHVTAVDPHQQLGSLAPMSSNLVAYGVADRVTVHIADSGIMTKFYELGDRFDLIWIDGDHSAEAVSHDVAWARVLLRPGGTLACHDYGEETCPGVRQALDVWSVPPTLIDTLAVYGPGEW